MVQAPPQTPTLSLQVPQGLSLHVTSEQFATLAAANRDLRLERTAIGELMIKPPTGGITGIQNVHITGQLGAWLETSDLGVAFASSTGFELPNRAIRSPDASWLSQVRWDALTQEQKEGFAPLCPDFVLELLSNTDTLEEIRAKMTEYIENGSRLGWLIDPKNKRVEVYRPGQDVGHYLARLHRKTFCCSKSLAMLKHSLRLLLYYLHFETVPLPPRFFF